jgi:alkylhydroperoxidase family enzyme
MDRDGAGKGGAALTQRVLDDYTTAPIDEKLRATLGLLRKMTLEPEALGPGDVRAVLALGVSREAVGEAMHVAYLFNIYDRLADTLGWDVPAQETGFYASSARMLLKRGYG